MVPVGRMVVRYGLLVAATPVLFLRFDQFSTFLMMLGLVAFVWGRRASSGVALGIGAATKLFPLFIVPVLAAVDLIKRDWSRLALLVAGTAAVVAAVGVVFFIDAGTSEFSFLSYHADRGVQLESLLASIGLAAQLLGSPAATVFHDFGSFQLDSPFLASVPWLPAVLAVALVIPLVASTLVRFTADAKTNGKVLPLTLETQLLATLLVVLLVYRVLSPQYLAWVLPLAAMRPRNEFWLMFAICLLTFAIYPLAYSGMVALTLSAVLALILRNALLVTMFIWLILQPRQRPAVAAHPIEAVTSAA